MDLIDTHQHLILRDKLGYAWTTGVPALQGDFAPEDYARLVAGKGVIGTVFMETGVDDGDYQAEARLIAELIGSGGMLGQIASCRPESDAGFDDWLEECRGLSVVGFRRLLHVVDDAISQSDGFRRNIRKIGAAGYTYDMVFHARQLGIAEALARACPDQLLVLDHCGNPDVAGDGFDAWLSGLKLMAALPHIWLKFSGITVNCTPGTASVPLLQRYTDAMLEVFGPARMIWGGDWPVVNLAIGLPDWIDMSRAMLSDLSADEQKMIGHQNARRVYGLAG
ncbi:amidohydrolase family protein [Cypionkella psychrotolerans]|uniref:amidohydrolase family protein n=1 Tax=Cypionkella psychrotolerans TaxID=1678131 RepID=UPI0006B5C8C0|nr:amidohydrolase [Cypionkella psychrotolerans]